MIPLKKYLAEDTDYESALFRLAVVLGIVSPDQQAWLRHKGEFCSNTELNRKLSEVMYVLVDQGFVRWSENGWQWREEAPVLE